MKNLKISLLFFAMNIFAFSVMGQESNSDKLKRMVESQNYVFKAQIAYPLGGNSRQLTSEYDLTITKNSITSFLPYFGKTYSPPIDAMGDGGIKFTSTNFEYKPAASGKGWKITIVPKDAQGVQQLYLNISNDGDATLEVVNTNRQSISFSGYVK